MTGTAHVGLRNLGDTCYINAVIQCLYHLGPLRSVLWRFVRGAYAHVPVPGGSAVAPALRQLFLDLLGSVDSFVETQPFATALGLSDDDCHTQCDAGEFLHRLVQGGD